MASKPPITSTRRGSAPSPIHSPKQISIDVVQEIAKDQFKDQMKDFMAEIMNKIDEKFKIQEERLMEMMQKQEEQAKEVMEELQEVKQDIRDEMIENNIKMREDIVLAVQVLSSKLVELDKRVEENSLLGQYTETKLEEIQTKLSNNENQITIMQYRDMEAALRIRGLKESIKQEDLAKTVIEALAELIQCQPEEVSLGIERIYRVNSWIAKQRNLPRDVVIYFSTKILRNRIMQASYRTKLQVEGQEIMVLKEIPPKMLRDRKDFRFLTEELNRRQIQFKWEVPVGISLSYQGKGYRIDTVLKAREFLTNILLHTETSSNGGKGMEESRPQERHDQKASGNQQYQIQEQRMTRAKKKKQEKELLQQLKQQQSLTQVDTAGAVGGARPKRQMEVDLQSLAQKLQLVRNDK